MCRAGHTPSSPHFCHYAVTLRYQLDGTTQKVRDMARQPEELTEMRRALGAQLTTYRTAAELSQDQLGKAVFRDRTTVNHIEKGYGLAQLATANVVLVNGDLGMVLPPWPGDAHHPTPAAARVSCFTIREGRVTAIYDIVNPDKLSRAR